MAKKPNIQRHKQPSPLKKAAEQAKQASVNALSNENMLLSFLHLDAQQGEPFTYWQEQGLLADAITCLAHYTRGKLEEQVDGDKFTKYKSFPPAEKTEYTHPQHVPPDAEWARIQVNGKNRVVGHVVRNVFYVVFMDAHHRFWKSEKKHT